MGILETRGGESRFYEAGIEVDMLDKPEFYYRSATNCQLFH